MKKSTILFASFLLFSINTFAQITKGTWLLGGSLSYSTNNNNYSGGNTFENTTVNGAINPTIGYFVTEKLALGINPGYQFNRNSSFQSPNQSIKSTTRNFSIGPFMRYYQALSDRVSIFGQAALGFTSGETDTENIFQNTSTTFISDNFGINVGINPGIVFFATRRLGFEATFGTLSYNYFASTTETSENKNTSLNLNLNISSLGVGLQYFLSR